MDQDANTATSGTDWPEHAESEKDSEKKRGRGKERQW